MASLVGTRSGSDRTRSMMSLSLALGVLVWRAGLELCTGMTEEEGALANVGGCWVCSSPSSKLSSRESMVDSKNWRHSCSSCCKFLLSCFRGKERMRKRQQLRAC